MSWLMRVAYLWVPLLLGSMLVASRVLLPRYAIMVALACVGGACSLEDPPKAANTPEVCSCESNINLQINGSSREMSICNNATFDWLVHTLLSQIAIEKEQVEEKSAQLKTFSEHIQEAEQEINYLNEDKEELLEENKRLKSQYEQLVADYDNLRQEKSKGNKDYLKPMDCADVQKFGYHYSGIYTIYPLGLEDGVRVFCDLNTDGGGWLIIQRRQDGSVDFARDWAEYKTGFGQLAEEFWLGNENISLLTKQRLYELRIDLTDYDEYSGFAKYRKFYVEDATSGYRLRVGNYSGDAGNSLGHHANHKFSTQDQDNDKSRSGHCSHLFGNGGWWYVRCYDSNLNGKYGRHHENKGVVWFHWRGDYTPLRHVEMKIRPVGF